MLLLSTFYLAHANTQTNTETLTLYTKNDTRRPVHLVLGPHFIRPINTMWQWLRAFGADVCNTLKMKSAFRAWGANIRNLFHIIERAKQTSGGDGGNGNVSSHSHSLICLSPQPQFEKDVPHCMWYWYRVEQLEVDLSNSRRQVRASGRLDCIWLPHTERKRGEA